MRTDPGLPRRRCDQAGGTEGRRCRAHQHARSYRQRQSVLSCAQRQQAQPDAQSEDRRGEKTVPGGDRAVRRAGGEFRPRRTGPAGPRLQGAVEAEPAADLRHDQGLRHLRPVQRLQELRADRAGDGRRDERHRLSREPTDLCHAGDRRFRHRHAHGDRHPGGAPAAASDRQGSARRGVDAGRGGEPDPRQPARPSALRRADAAQGQPARPERAWHHLCLRARRAERLRVHLRAAADVEGADRT